MTEQITTDQITNITVVGDSISMGAIYSEEKHRYRNLGNGYVDIIRKLLVAPIENVSKFGALVSYGQKTIADFEELSDVVLVEFGGNDCNYKWDEIAENPTAEHHPATEPEVFSSTLTDIVGYIKNAGKRAVLINLPPLVSDRYFDWFTDKDEKKGESILKWLNYKEYIGEWQKSYSDIIENVAKTTGAFFIDIRRAFVGADFRKLMCIDGIHPNEAGQKLIAEVIRNFIEQNAGYLLSPAKA